MECGDQITTFYFEGGTRIDHAAVPVEPDSLLDASTYRVGMVHGAGGTGQGAPGSGTARFGNPRLEGQQSVRPPGLDRRVENHQATVDQPAVLTITGVGLTNTHLTVSGGTGCAMPYDCSAAPTPLATWALNAIEQWINSGAPEN